jgi:hypothetical protein
MQNVVGGAMNIVLLPDGNAIVSNKNAQIKNLEPNRLIDGHVVRGYFFVCRIFDEKFASITLIDAKNYLYNCRWPMAQQAGAVV